MRELRRSKATPLLSSVCAETLFRGTSFVQRQRRNDLIIRRRTPPPALEYSRWIACGRILVDLEIRRHASQSLRVA
ncbi:MAG: hypothetical protein MI923_08080 [Phycisphaerales bacterium]|nr:hypothetical protein [Phycisphaerales bacterium]